LACIAFLPIVLHCSGVLHYICNRIYISYNVPFVLILIHLAFHRRWSCVFHPRNLVLRFPFLPFPPLRFGPTFSSPAFSTPVFFMVPRFPVPRFQSPKAAPAFTVRHCIANKYQLLTGLENSRDQPMLQDQDRDKTAEFLSRAVSRPRPRSRGLQDCEKPVSAAGRPSRFECTQQFRRQKLLCCYM